MEPNKTSANATMFRIGVRSSEIGWNNHASIGQPPANTRMVALYSLFF